MGTAITSYCHRCKQRIVGLRHRYDGKEYCDECYNTLMQELQELEQQKVALYAYIGNLFGVSECPDYVIYAIDKAIKSGKKVKGIEGTIYWYYQIQNHLANNIGEVVTIINTEYENARKYVASQREIARQNEEVNFTDIPAKTVQIVSNRRKKKWKSNYRMEDL